MVNNGMLSAFVEIWHLETSFFHLSHGEISITLEDVSCMLHFPIMERMLDHDMINRVKVVKMMVEYSGVGPRDTMQVLEATCGCHARFRLLDLDS